MVEGAASSPLPFTPPGLYSPISSDTTTQNNLHAFYKNDNLKTKSSFDYQRLRSCLDEILSCDCQGPLSVPNITTSAEQLIIR